MLTYMTDQHERQYRQYIDAWLRGDKPGTRGIRTVTFSGHVRRYLIGLAGDKCTRCFWAEKNPATGKVPLEVDHIDGDHTNNRPENLAVLCPNCHALTPTFRNLNRGHGRKFR